MGNTFCDQETFIVSFWGKIIKMISNFCVGMICNPSLRNTTTPYARQPNNEQHIA